MAMPSPVLMPALVVKGNARPAPPVAMITAGATKTTVSPVLSSMATQPPQRPSATSRSTTKYSSKRRIAGYFSDV